MKSLLNLLVIFLLLSSNFSAYAQSGPQNPTESPSNPQVPAQTPQTTQADPNAFPTISQTEAEEISGNLIPIEPYPGPMCVQPSNGNGLSSQESQNILDLLKTGFVGEEIRGNANPGKTPDAEDREKLEKNAILAEHPNDASKATQINVPSEKLNPFEVTQYLNVHIKGPFAFGLVLDDTLRAGRCSNYDSIECYLVGKNLKYRNSDDGLISTVKPLTDIGAKLTSFFSDENESSVMLSPEEEKAFRENAELAAALTTDSSDVQPTVKTVSRLEKELTPNSILTQDFEAKIGTNCNDGKCIIQTYSYFDKYFNQWLSSEMAVSTFGPTLFNKAKNLVGWTGRRGGVLREHIDEFLDNVRYRFEQPDSILGKIKLERMEARKSRNGWDEFWQSMTTGNSADGTGYPLAKTEEFLNWWAKQDHFIEGIKGAEKKAEFIRLLKDLRTFARVQHYQLNKATVRYKGIIDSLGGETANVLEHPHAKQAIREYGQSLGKFIGNYDDYIGLDLPDWFVRNPNVGLYDKGLFSVNTNDVRDLFSDHRLTRVVLDKFVDTGSWKNFENEFHLYNGAFKTDGQGNLLFYSFDPASATDYRALSYSNLGPAAKNTNNIFARLDNGEIMRYTPASAKFIQSKVGGNAQLVQGNWKQIGVLTPEELTMRIANPRIRGNFNKIQGNVDTMLKDLYEKKWVSRRYWNALDKLMAEEDEIIRTYFTVKGGAKWTVYPFGYWWLKKGADQEGFSFYQLPDDWSTIFFSLGDEKEVYDYSYVDFFANAGSDSGDLFIKVINALPWKSLVYDQISDRFNPAKDFYDYLSGKQIRTEVEDLAIYMTGPNKCDNCTITIDTNPNLDYFRPYFSAKNQALTSYLLEDTRSQEAKDKGTTIIAYTHKTNLNGKTNDIEGQAIDLAEAIENDADEDPDKLPKSCAKAVENLPLYGTALKILPFLPKEEGVGGALAAVESLTYVSFFWPGVFASAVIQIGIAPHLQDCVDTKGGYYVHYFLPVKKETDQKTGKTNASTEKVTELLRNASDSLFGGFSTQGGDGNQSVVAQKTNDVKAEIEKLTGKAENNGIVQARLEVSGGTSGQMRGLMLFYFWCGEGCDTQHLNSLRGVEEISDKNTDTKIKFDNQKGELTQNGVPIVTNPDVIRNRAQDLSVPATLLPKNLTTFCVEPSNDLAIEINSTGVATVTSPEAMECIRAGILEQTGVPLRSNDLSEAFGLVESVITTTHPNIFPNQNEIVAEGVPRKIASGNSAKVFVAQNQNVTLSTANDSQPSVGKLRAIKFKNGVITAKQNGCFIVWLRHHEAAILNQRDIESLKPKLTTSINPENMCPEPAIDFEVIANQQSDLSIDKVNNFNNSLQKLGPFQVFETPTKRYMLFSERDEAGECQDHLRVIDKETGEITDYVGKATQTPTGIAFTDQDGKTHTLDFNAQNGVPTVSFDGQKPEVLTSAQGRNGAFYYDPSTGQWYAENAQLLPILEAFREGIATKANGNNEAVSTATGNLLNVNLSGKDNNLLNLPSLPENPIALAVFVILLVSVIIVIRTDNLRKRKFTQ